MNHIQATLPATVLLLLTTVTAHAQRHHFPSVAGKYETSNAEVCWITQDANVIFISSTVPGVSKFHYTGTFGRCEQLDDTGRRITRDGFHGEYRLTFADGRPSLEGAAGIYPNTQTQQVQIRYFFRAEGDDLSTTAGVTVLKPVSNVVMQQPKLSETTDEFNILPLDDLDSIGL